MTNKFKYPRDYSFQVVLGPHENFNVLSLSGECICLDKERHFFFFFFLRLSSVFLAPLPEASLEPGDDSVCLRVKLSIP